MREAFFAFHICIARRKFLRCQVAQSAVWMHLVVIDPPAFDGLPRIVQSEEPVFVEALLAELAMEAFDVAVLHRPSWCDEVQCDLVLIGPLVQSLRSELRAVINDNPYCHASICLSLSNTRTTRSAGNEVSTSIASISRVYASSIDSVRSLRPEAKAS